MIYTEKESEYLKKNPNWHIEDSPWKAKQIINMLNRHHLELKTIAEVGCGAGEILNQLYLTMPKDTFFAGYDISYDAINLATQRENDRIKFNHADFLATSKRYDLLLMMDVFEHVRDYLGFITSCKSKADFFIFHIPLDLSVQSILRNKLITVRKSSGHLHYFMKETAIATLQDSGFEVIDFYFTQGSFDLPRKTFMSKLAYLPRKIVYKFNPDIASKLFGGFSLLVLAK